MLTLMICLMLARQEAPSTAPDDLAGATDGTSARWAHETVGCMQGPRSCAWAAAAPLTKTRDTCAVVWHAGETADMAYNACVNARRSRRVERLVGRRFARKRTP